MKSGIIVVIAVIVLLAAVGGYIYISNSDYDDSDGVYCTADVFECPDGSFVSRNSNNNCEFFACPATNGNSQVNNSIPEPQTVNLDISGFAFVPATMQINVGDTVIWTNQDSTSHTVTSDSGNELNSPYLSQGQIYSHTFTSSGTFDYHCKPHPSMKGKIIVR
ncbi:MAG: cupredoxin family copper-binding protein [Candidatus Pacearchaeota archaeon]